LKEREYFMLPVNDLTRGIARSDEAAEAIARVLRSGNWIHGPEHAAFENEFAQFLEVDHVLGVASGTDALEIALRAVGCSRGSKIISVANAGGYTSIAAASIGCDVIYCDVDIEKLVMDPVVLKPLLSKDISAVVVTHLYGNIAPAAEIKDMCDVYGIPVIEDCAQAAGGLEGNNRVGSIGDIGTFSFYPTKNLGAIGDAGAIITSNEKLDAISKSLRNYGQSDRYHHPLLGLNSRLDEIQAAILINKCEQIDNQIYKRRLIAKKYNNSINNIKIKKLAVPNDIENHVYHLYVIRCENRNLLQKYLLDLGIQTLAHYPIPIHKQVSVHGISVDPIGMGISERYASECLSIPCHPELNDFQVQKVIEAINGF
jgi:dTDP-4-amino-4,6-dideoxygalactose transaminase